MNIEKMLKYQRKFIEDRNWEQFHSPKNIAMALNVESSELLEIFQWIKEEHSWKVMTESKSSKAVKDEVADVFYYLLRICDLLDIDLEKAFWEKTKQNEEKYPVDKSKGNAKKYNEL